jgi:hypothetical protein
MTQNHDGKIKDVYEENIEDEIRNISYLIDEYNFVSMVKSIIKILRILNSQGLFFLSTQTTNLIQKMWTLYKQALRAKKIIH